jgi:hypothetical protein
MQYKIKHGKTYNLTWKTKGFFEGDDEGFVSLVNELFDHVEEDEWIYGNGYRVPKKHIRTKGAVVDAILNWYFGSSNIELLKGNVPRLMPYDKMKTVY